ncbi:MAG: IS256 family transposase [Crenarchaeota archaeon]|nr:IS256 family transposase [Thermoproteota archaeon]
MEAKKLATENLLQIQVNVKREIWDFLEKGMLDFLKKCLETLFDQALKEQVGAERYQRTEQRKDYRNGSYTRSLTTKFGHLPNLEVPRLRHGSLSQEALDRYERIHEDVERAIGQLFLAGVSTRRLRSLSQELFGRSISAQTVSKTTEALNQELEQYRQAPLDDEYEFLFLDGIHDRVREIGVEHKVMLCALGICKDGSKRILAFRLVDQEDEAVWSAFLVELKTRGLKGEQLKIITSDGQPGLLKALRQHFTFVPQQRCIAHKMRNVIAKLKRSQKQPCAAEARLIWAAPNRKEAVRRFKEWEEKWYPVAESAVQCLRKDLFACLKYYDLPEEKWKVVRTTNALERTFREVRRRTRPMNLFPNEKSAQKIFYGITKYLNQNWNPSQTEFTQKG